VRARAVLLTLVLLLLVVLLLLRPLWLGGRRNVGGVRAELG
jgi:hypothetical protein